MAWNYVAIAITIAVIISVSFFFLKKQRARKLNQLLLLKQYDEFNRVLSWRSTSFLFSKVIQKDYQLKEAYLRNKPRRIYELIDEILNARITINYREQILMQAFNYALNSKDADRATKYYELIQSVPNPQLKEEVDIMYDIYILKGDKYLDFLLQKVSETEPMYNGINEFLIAEIYGNKHDSKQSKYYYKQAEAHMKELDHHIAMKKK